MLDAVEESIRDIMECFLVKAEIKKVADSEDFTKNNKLHTLHTISDDSEEMPQVIEDELRAVVVRKQSEKHLDKKFMNLNKILAQFANSTHYVEKVRLMRIYLFLVIVIGK